MPYVLAHDHYGKSRVRLVHVARHPDRHDLKDLSLDIRLEGDFAATHLEGDNRSVLPTDTMKNTVYALAREHSVREIEPFALLLADHFLKNNPQVTRASIDAAERNWNRIGRFAYSAGPAESRIAEIDATRDGARVTAGIDNLIVLKTKGSGFEGYIHDRYTTLKETADRLFGTAIGARWTYDSGEVAYGPTWHTARKAIVDTFIEHESLSVQHTAYAMAEAALDAVAQIGEIRLALPNRHCLLVDLAPFGLDNPNEVFLPIDEPHGQIEITVKRG
ncbi:MAG: factor-independent urate hydroxylase [Bryobacteraceae bacterium]